MTKRDEANKAHQRNASGKGERIARPTVKDVLNNVPGARQVRPDLLPPEVRHLSEIAPDA